MTALVDWPPGPLDTYRKQARFDWRQMRDFFEDPEALQIKMQVWRTLERDPVFQRAPQTPTTEQMKRQAALQLLRYCQYNFLHPDTARLPYKRKTRYMMTVNEALAVAFPDVSIKHAIGIGLFKNTLTTLGTARHQQFIDAAWNNKVVACLALTEVAHGSNTKLMRTTATYDAHTEEFVIETPDFQAAKCWVGNLGKTCTLALLFAQLYTKGRCHGLHAFVVPVRDPATLLPYPGLVIGDMGEKIGLHGIDNGFIIFKGYRVPRENLLNRTGDVTAAGDYESSFSDPGRILGAALENLSAGRVGIMQESSNNMVCAVAIALRYGAVRRQFGPGGAEWPLVEYQLHRWRLFPHLAAAAVLRTFVRSFTESYLSAVELATTSQELQDLSDLVAEIHAIVSGAKAHVTWACRDAVQECREACGGHGFLKRARLGDLRTINDPCVTYEGDNNVLLQQTSNWLLRQWQGVGAAPLGSCAFLRRPLEAPSGRAQDFLDESCISRCYEWLIRYLVEEMERRVGRHEEKFVGRAEAQVYCATVLSRAFIEHVALQAFWERVRPVEGALGDALRHLGHLYGLWSLDKHVAYFYQGGFAQDALFGARLKEAVLHVCDALKPDFMGLVDGMAPPDYVLDSVLGRSDGQLYDNIEAELFQSASALSRPDWWREVLIEDAPDFVRLRSKL